MNQKNYEYLQEQLLYSGFGESMDAALKKAIKTGESKFVLQFQRQDEREYVRAELHYSKSQQSDMYFFNGYKLELENRQSEQQVSQYFRVNGRDRYTLKEAYNLLHGRAVHKELTNKQAQRYSAWVQLDFKTVDLAGNRKFNQYHENYGFDLKAALEKLPIAELQYDESKSLLINSLERGNRHEVTFLLHDQERTVSIQANPKFKSLALYDGDQRLEFVSNPVPAKTSEKQQELEKTNDMETKANKHEKDVSLEKPKKSVRSKGIR
ncbi:hypothetical protein GQF61_07585 [Sphingobacterium sp. DK4209]|uniref:DUF3945 domain-containing protein n=1 Tax=Sphingobacterium zhuxiongii TaxID=2662364 RepID=A0A5Q0QDL5_9SPHI|nr:MULTISPECIES: hypothetical protein [unclassified Sphingobacterium]MVZ65716.1 hypothetical protein [Sphingobacterium sp. DK4209]QGA27915.1 hypothetical protein GFH32_16980 [Sphingobacterium sp. dk4302]